MYGRTDVGAIKIFQGISVHIRTPGGWVRLILTFFSDDNAGPPIVRADRNIPIERKVVHIIVQLPAEEELGACAVRRGGDICRHGFGKQPDHAGIGTALDCEST